MARLGRAGRARACLGALPAGPAARRGGESVAAGRAEWDRLPRLPSRSPPRKAVRGGASGWRGRLALAGLPGHDCRRPPPARTRPMLAASAVRARQRRSSRASRRRRHRGRAAVRSHSPTRHGAHGTGSATTAPNAAGQ